MSAGMCSAPQKGRIFIELKFKSFNQELVYEPIDILPFWTVNSRCPERAQDEGTSALLRAALPMEQQIRKMNRCICSGFRVESLGKFAG